MARPRQKRLLSTSRRTWFRELARQIRWMERGRTSGVGRKFRKD